MWPPSSAKGASHCEPVGLVQSAQLFHPTGGANYANGTSVPLAGAEGGSTGTRKAMPHRDERLGQDWSNAVQPFELAHGVNGTDPSLHALGVGIGGECITFCRVDDFLYGRGARGSRHLA